MREAFTSLEDGVLQRTGDDGSAVQDFSPVNLSGRTGRPHPRGFGMFHGFDFDAHACCASPAMNSALHGASGSPDIRYQETPAPAPTENAVGRQVG